jgi:hypothetical protein
MATLDELRKHVLDDAIELIEVLGVVTPLVTAADVRDPAKLLLRRLLARHVILVLTRLHAPAGTGRSGVTASIDSVLNAAAGSSLLSTTAADQFKMRRTTLKKDMEPDGVSFKDIHLFRNTELAHSLHAHVKNSRGVMWYVIDAFAEGTYNLINDIEDALIKAGAPMFCSLPEGRLDEWTKRGRALWNVPT